jgi:hypothetical protein
VPSLATRRADRKKNGSRLAKKRWFNPNDRALITIGKIGRRFSEKTVLQTKKFATIAFD